MKKPKKGVSQADLVRHWNVGKSYVSRLVSEGMPLESVEAAEEWRNNRGQRMGTRTKDLPVDKIEPEKEEPEEFIEPDHDELLGIDMTGLERELKNAREMARSAAKRVRQAEKGKGLDAVIGQRQQTYNKAVENYERMEKSVRRERQSRGELMTVEQHKVQLNRLWVPAITLMRKLPRTAAPKVCPGDDVAAEKILAEGVEEVITEMRRSLGDEPDPAWHLTVFMAATLRDHGPERVVALLEESIQSIKAAVVGTPS